MTRVGRVRPARAWVQVSALVLALAGCGSASGDGRTAASGPDGRMPATPRALAAVVIDHVHPGEPRRSTGGWSDWNDPPAIDAQVDYGVDPEGAESGETRTVRVTVADAAAYHAEDRRWWRCRPAQDDGRCEHDSVGGARLLYRWSPGAEEEESGTYSWTVVRAAEVVQVSYEGSGLFDRDPRALGLAVDPADLRDAALDRAMSLRTTRAAYAAGADLDGYHGEEHPPEQPTVTATTPPQLADRVVDYVGRRARSVTRSQLTAFGPDAAGAHLEFPGTPKADPFTVDVLTTVGRVRQIDPLPCGVQRVRTAVRDRCFAWNRDTAVWWTLAANGKPGEVWVVGAQDDDTFNRVESVGIRIMSTGITQDFFADPGIPWTARFPVDLLGYLYPLTADLSVGPEQRATP